MPTSVPSYYCDCSTVFTEYLPYVEHFVTCEECYREVCPSIVESHYVSCGECDDDYLCGTRHMCYSSERDRGIFNYSYTPNLEFRGTGDYFLGMELEISTGEDDSAHPIYEWANRNNVPGLFFCKEDSSVDGFEIVTHPMTPEFFETVNWESFFSLLNNEYPCGEDESDGHGLHVHVSRTAFSSSATLARWAYLVNANRRDVERVARRTSTEWAPFTRKPVSEALAGYVDTSGRSRRRRRRSYSSEQPIFCTPENCQRLNWSGEPERCLDHWMNWDRCHLGYGPPPPIPAREKFDGTAQLERVSQFGAGRYRALNMTNHDTVEMRVFKSTRSAAEFRDSIRFVYSSVEFVRSMQPCHTIAPREALSWAAYTEYVMAQHAALYPTLAGLPAA